MKNEKFDFFLEMVFSKKMLLFSKEKEAFRFLTHAPQNVYFKTMERCDARRREYREKKTELPARTLQTASHSIARLRCLNLTSFRTASPTSYNFKIVKNIHAMRNIEIRSIVTFLSWK